MLKMTKISKLNIVILTINTKLINILYMNMILVYKKKGSDF